MRPIACLLTAALLAAAAGCERAVVIRQGVAFRAPGLRSMRGRSAPVVPVRDAAGNVSTLDGSAGPIYVVAVVPPPAGSPNAADPKVVRLVRYLHSSTSADLVQLTIPVEGRPLDPNARPADERLPLRMRHYLDPDRVAWGAFDKPAPGTLLLFDEHGYLAGQGTLEKPDWIMFRADRMGWEYEREQDISFSGTDDD